MTNDPEVVEEWVWETKQIHRDELNRLIVGLAVECTPGMQNRAPVMQLCVADRCLVNQILWSVESAPPLGSIYDFLSNPRDTFVGINIKSDLEKLQRGHLLLLVHLKVRGLGKGGSVCVPQQLFREHS